MIPNYSTSDLRDEYRLPVEELAVRRLAEATWDDSPRFRRGDCSSSVDVPPIYGCLAATLAGRPHSLEVLGFDVARSFHGEETILLYAPLRIGQTILVRDAVVRLPDVVGSRGGAMRRARRRSLLLDEEEKLVGVVTRTMLETSEALVSSVPTGDATVFDDGLSVRADPVEVRSIPLRSASVGHVLGRAEFGPITRTDVVRYAAASADFTAIHFDERAARSRGYKTTFAMGMLSGAFIGHVVSDWFELDYPWRLSLRFRDQVWPGDTLVISGEVTVADGEKIKVSIVCSSDRGPVTSAVLEHWRAGVRPPGPDDY